MHLHVWLKTGLIRLTTV